MRSLISEATLFDLLLVFGTFAAGGFIYAYFDVYGLSKAESALQIPAGAF